MHISLDGADVVQVINGREMKYHERQERNAPRKKETVK